MEVDKIESLLMQILSAHNKTNERLERVEEGIEKLESKVEVIKNQLSEFEAKTANYHLETINGLNDITESIDFLKHEDLKTRQDVYTLKKKITISK